MTTPQDARSSSTALPSYRDVFLSHRFTDKDFVRSLAADVETERFQGRNLLTWVDEAEIRPGQSVPGMINEGLEKSRFIALVMTPEYFRSESGWTDAEWHAALHGDPDNRKARLIPLLVADCPYIPFLLRHLNAIDFRGNRYAHGLEQLLLVLREEPLPRPVAYRGQLVTPSGRVDRSTLLAERAAPEADPDVVSEKLYCNLLPVERLPRYVYTAPISGRLRRPRPDGTEALPSKLKLKDTIRAAQEEAEVERPFMPAFRMVEDRIVTFHDLESPDGPLACVVEDEYVETIPTTELAQDEDDRRLLVSLLNMAIARHAGRAGLVIDGTKQGRFYFPPKDGEANVITWRPLKRKARRTVAKSATKDGEVLFWRHLGAYLSMLFLANRFYLKVTPTWVITEDGQRVRGGPKVGRLVGNWTRAERNLHVLYHVRFWTTVLSKGSGTISVRAGDQWMELDTVPAFVQQSYGIANDQRDLLRLLDQEAELIAEAEDEEADRVTEVSLDREESPGDDEQFAEESVEEDLTFDDVE